MVSDGELIQRTGAGDQTAFETLYRRHARPVFGLAMRRLGDSGGPRMRCRTRSRRSGARRAPTGPSAASAPPGSTPSRGTRSSIAAARSASRPPATRPSWFRSSSAPTARRADVDAVARPPGDPAAARTAAPRDRAPLLERPLAEPGRGAPGPPLGTVKTRTRSALLQLAKLLEGELGDARPRRPRRSRRSERGGEPAARAVHELIVEAGAPAGYVPVSAPARRIARRRRGARRRRALAARGRCVLARRGGDHGPRAHAAALPRTGVLVHGESLAGVELGDSEADVRALWGRHFTVCSGCDGTTWFYIYPTGDPFGAGVRFRDGHVTAVFTLGAPHGGATTKGCASARCSTSRRRPPATRSGAAAWVTARNRRGTARRSRPCSCRASVSTASR